MFIFRVILAVMFFILPSTIICSQAHNNQLEKWWKFLQYSYSMNDLLQLLQGKISVPPGESIEDTVKLLCLRVSDINIKDEDGSTILHKAVSYNSSNIIALLLQWGASPMMRNNALEIPLHVALRTGHYDNAQLLLQWSNTFSQINACDNNGDTPLLVAIKNQNISSQFIIDELWSRYASMLHKNNHGEDALSLIEKNNRSNLNEFLQLTLHYNEKRDRIAGYYWEKTDTELLPYKF